MSPYPFNDLLHGWILLLSHVAASSISHHGLGRPWTSWCLMCRDVLVPGALMLHADGFLDLSSSLIFSTHSMCVKFLLLFIFKIPWERFCLFVINGSQVSICPSQPHSMWCCQHALSCHHTSPHGSTVPIVGRLVALHCLQGLSHLTSLLSNFHRNPRAFFLFLSFFYFKECAVVANSSVTPQRDPFTSK